MQGLFQVNLAIMRIPVIDIFAGPGGLGEGFSAAEVNVRFNIRLSIEKDHIAHQTLQLRSFLRTFGYDAFPAEYYEYVKGKITRDELYKAYPAQARHAAEEVWQVELGVENSEHVHDRIEKALGGNRHWVLLGGPPCQAYSLVGRARMTGLGIAGKDLEGKELDRLRQKKLKNFYQDHRHTLYKEYLKIVAVHKPTVFVMENVKGILSSKNEDDEPIFRQILQDLQDPWKAISADEKIKKSRRLSGKSPRYRLFSFVRSSDIGAGYDTNSESRNGLKPRDFIIQAEKYGIPQKRHRVIILGILEDYDAKPEVLTKIAKAVSVRAALENLPELRSGLSKEQDSSEEWEKLIRKGFRAESLRKLDAKTSSIIRRSLNALNGSGGRGAQYIPGSLKKSSTELSRWLSYDTQLKGTLQHETRGHMTSDLWRYLFVSAYTEAHGHSPKVDEFPEWLSPDHKNVKNPAKSGDGFSVHFKDRFRAQMADDAATTITSHISKDGHYYIHYDPAQCRSLTVREAARLQTFPDNYFFEGNRTQQYHQVGNAVPPLLAYKLAGVVAGVIEQCVKADKKAAQGSARERKEAAA